MKRPEWPGFPLPLPPLPVRGRGGRGRGNPGSRASVGALFRNLRWLALVWLSILAFLAPLAGGEVPWDPDVASTFLPFKIVGATLLRSGHLPLWTPLVELGFPVLAEGQGGLLYPPDVALFLLLPPFTAFALSVVFHALVGSGLMYWLARRLGRSRAAAALVALVFSFAGPLLPLAGTPRMEVATWWPALLIAVDGLAGARAPRGRAGWLAFGAGATALLVLAGHPQVAVMGLILAGCFAVYRTTGLERRDQVGALGWCLAMVVLGSGLAAPQLFATLAIVGQSARATGAGLLAGQGSLFPLGLAEILAPNWSFAATLGAESPNAYVGVVALALGWVALARRMPGARFWAGLALVMTLLAFGRFTPLYLLTSHLPALDYFRVPARYLYVVTMALAMLGALGLDALRDSKAAGVRPLTRAVVVLGGGYVVVNLAGALVVIVLSNRLVTVASALTGIATNGRGAKWQHLLALAARATSPDNTRFLAPLFGFAGLIALIVLLRRDRTRAAIAVTVATLFVEFWVGAPRVALGIPHRPATVDVVERLGPGRIYSYGDPFTLAVAGRHDLLPASENAIYGIASIGLYDPLGNLDYRDLLAPLGAVNLSTDTVEPTADAVRANRRLLDLLGVSVVLSPAPLDGFTLVERVGNAHVYENPDAFPRAWVVGSLARESGDPRAALLAPTLNLHDVALVNGAPVNVRGQSGPARVLSDRGDEVAVNASGPGVLVLADRWAPGWRATVDGVNVPVLRVDGVLRGVVLPGGQHQVIFRYWPASFANGILVAILAALGLIVVGAWSRR